MSYLQALQKARIERESVMDRAGIDETERETTNGNGNGMPGVLSTQNLSIGGPGSTLRAGAVETVEAPTSESPIAPILPMSIGSHRGDLSGVPEITVDELSVNPHAVSITQPQSIHCEEYRSLRTHLLRQSKLEMLQAIVIASMGVGEGKSVTALNLSWLLAQTEGVSALLIDCDLRRPSMSSYFGLNLKSGLSDVLDGTMGLTDAIVKLNPAGLYLLPGGRSRNDVAELISGSMFPQILQEARSIFDYVIIDAPPLGVFTDAAVLINQTDAALLVVAANQTNYKDVNRVMESIPKERMLGVVLNKSDESLIDGDYYDYPNYSSVRG